MKRLILMAASALLMMTQCRKSEVSPVTPSDGVKMTVTVNPGRVTVDDVTGAITWTDEEKLYVSDGKEWIGVLTNNGAGGGTFSGNIASFDNTTEYHFFYFGKLDVADASGDKSVTVWLKYQGGTKEGALRYQVGHGAKTFDSAEGADNTVTLRSLFALARIDFTKKDADGEYKDMVKLGGGLVNEVTVSPVFSAEKQEVPTTTVVTKGDIYLGETTGKTKWVMLAPTTEKIEMSVNGDPSILRFDGGIEAGRYYGMSSPLPAEFSKDFEIEYVEIGGVKWATWNVGAHSPTEYGDYFQWGEVENVTKTGSDADVINVGWATCPHSDGTYGVDGKTKVFTKYVQTEQAETYWAGTDEVDNKTVLESGDDAATKNWGTDWRMPKTEEWKALYEGAKTKAWTSNYKNTGVAGYYMDFEGGPALFLPAAGYRGESSLYNAGSYGSYWSSSLYSTPSYAYYMGFGSGYVDPQNYSYRYDGFMVRPVRVAVAQ